MASKENETTRRQRAQIEKLTLANTNLQQELSLETKYATLASNPAAAAQIAKLQDQADMYTRKIELEKKRTEEIDKQIEMMQKKVMEQRKRMGGVNAAKENNQQIKKQIKILENRLDKALQKYNESLAGNKQLRSNIDSLRRERIVFDQIYKKLENELQEKQRTMQDVIEKSNKAYESRDKAQAEMIKLKRLAEEEQRRFDESWRKIGQDIEVDRKMKRLAAQKGKKEGERDSGHRGDMTVEEEKKLRRKVIRGNWNIAKDKANQQVSMEKVQSYEEAFSKIKEATGISDIDELVNTFIAAEDQNFKLFNYVNELNVECEKLEEQICSTKDEIEKFKGEGADQDNTRKKILQDLESRLSKTETKAEVYEAKYSSALKTVEALKTGIASIFSKLGCHKMSSADVLGESGVTDSNMMQYLGIIEQRTNEILQMYAMSATGDGTGPNSEAQKAALASVLGAGPSVPPGSSALLRVEPPSTQDEFDDDEEDEERAGGVPLSFNQLKAKTLHRLQKQEAGEYKPKGRNSRGKGK